MSVPLKIDSIVGNSKAIAEINDMMTGLSLQITQLVAGNAEKGNLE